MELKLDEDEIKAILLVHVNRLMPEVGFNRGFVYVGIALS